MEIPWGGGSNVKPSEIENPGEGWGSNWKKPSVGAMNILWNHTFFK